MRRFLLTCAVAVATVIPHSTTAQHAPDALRMAGNGARFRVIQRIPPVKRPVVEEVAWPFPDAVREAVAMDDWTGAWKHIEQTEPPNDERFAFLWGWVALGAGANDRAEIALTNLADENGLLADYANLYAGEAAFRAGRYDVAAGRAARVAPDSIPHRSASLLLAKALVRGEDADKGIRALRAFIDAFSDDEDAPTARVELARALHAQGNHEDAAKLLIEVRRKTPLWRGLDEGFDVLEKSVLDELPRKTRQKLSSRDADDYLDEYRVRFRAHQSEAVISGLEKAVEKWKKSSTERCEGLYLVGNSYTKLRKHADSVPWYQRIVSECRGNPHYLKALYKGGKGYWNAGNKDGAFRYFEKIWNEFQKHSYADDAMYFASRILTEQDKVEEAKKLLKRQVQSYPDGDMASDAHWLLVRDHFRSQDYKTVVAYVDGLKDLGERDLYSRGRLHYFRARALHKLGDERAKAAYEAVIRDYPMSYYALYAFNRLAELNGARSGADVCAIDDGALCAVAPVASPKAITVDDELQTNGSFQRGKAFLQVALDGFAALEFRRLRSAVGDDPDKQWALAALLDAAGAYPYSHDIARREIDGWEDEYPDRERSVRWGVGYPTPFETHVNEWAKRRELPEAIIWAIMREESGFNPRVRSWAGAIGLMQLMPGTAKMMASKDGWRYSEAELTEPNIAVRIGSAYLDDLADRSKEHPVLIISGYNGGWGNVSRWLEKPDSNDIDLWVEDIPYGQTRDYTKRVLRSFWVYSWLYGDSRVPRFDLTL